MNNIDKANEQLFDILNNNINNLDTLAVVFQDIKTLLLNTSTEMCELQKQKCANIARDVVQEEILNCKNICEN